MKILDIYAELCENYLMMPVLKGQKTEKEKFAGAIATYTIESMMHDGKGLQAGTTHFFGDGFARAFDIKYTDKNNELQYCWQSSWGVSTRLIGGIVMTHGDNRGLVLPPAIAPIQVRIMPIASHKSGVIEKAEELKDSLAQVFRCDIDLSDNSAGFKFAEQEMRGIPLRLEIGPRDIEQNQCVLVRRDNSEKVTAPLDGLEETLNNLLAEISANLYAEALENRANRSFEATTLDEIIKIAQNQSGFIKAAWCGALECELGLKEKADVTSRCIISHEHNGKCAYCGEPADKLVWWGKAY